MSNSLLPSLPWAPLLCLLSAVIIAPQWPALKRYISVLLLFWFGVLVVVVGVLECYISVLSWFGVSVAFVGVLETRSHCLSVAGLPWNSQKDASLCLLSTQ